MWLCFSFSLGSFSYFLVFPLRFWHLLEKRFVGLRVNKVASCSGSMSFSRGERALQAALEEELCSVETSGICVWERWRYITDYGSWSMVNPLRCRYALREMRLISCLEILALEKILVLCWETHNTLQKVLVLCWEAHNTLQKVSPTEKLTQLFREVWAISLNPFLSLSLFVPISYTSYFPPSLFSLVYSWSSPIGSTRLNPFCHHS